MAIKGAPYWAHAQFSDPATILALAAPAEDFVLMKAMHHYARAIAYIGVKDFASAQREVGAIAGIARFGTFKKYTDWAVPAQEMLLGPVDAANICVPLTNTEAVSSASTDSDALSTRPSKKKLCAKRMLVPFGNTT